jgi:predicted transcriptional regulator/DNA-binding XRE family transcriptional regulator
VRTEKRKENPRLGAKVKLLRRREGLTQQQLADRLSVSPAYLNLIENNRRPLPAHLLIQLAQTFKLDLATFSGDDEGQLGNDLLEVFGDPLFDGAELTTGDARELVASQPSLARAVIALYRAYQSARGGSGGGALPEQSFATEVPSEEVSDLLQRHMNYFPELEELAESVRKEGRIADDDLTRGLVRYLEDKHGITVEIVRAGPRAALGAEGGQRVLRSFDVAQKHLSVSELLPPRSRNFQLAVQICLLVGRDFIDRIMRDAVLTTDEARSLARVALANYFAGAMLMPYDPFLEAAEKLRYDIELLGHRFRTSFEQVCHRVTTLRRPGNLGVPFHLIRVDIAGNISKRFSASGIRFARFAGACPRWNVFTAFLTPGMIKTQVSEMPDGTRYFCISSTIRKQSVGYGSQHSPLALGLGCQIEHAKKLVYADGVDLDHATPVGVTCRMCERNDCAERAFPAVHAPLHVDENVRGVSFYANPLRIV